MEFKGTEPYYLIVYKNGLDVVSVCQCLDVVKALAIKS